MKIAIGADHGGYQLKEELLRFLKEESEDVEDFGTDSEERCDYPDIAARGVKEGARGKADRGVLICTTGIGMAIVANKFPGIRAAACYNEDAARMSRKDNDANVLTTGGKYVTPEDAKKILRIWLKTDFLGETILRHMKRVDKIRSIEEELKEC